MEHRYAGRIEAAQDVVICNMTGINLKGKLRNISRDGMYIRTDAQCIQKGETLDIEMANSCCIRGWVVHVGNEGIGVLLVTPPAGETPSASPPIPLTDICLNCLDINCMD
jgi:PilZ domain